MSFMDKVKSTMKAGAEQAATKAQEELDRMQTRRELGQAYSDLGEKAFSLVERSEISHPELEGLVDHVKRLREKLGPPTAVGGAEPEPEAEPEAAAAEPQEPPPST
jgi:hypothetical protein